MGFLGAKAVIYKREQSEWSADVRVIRPMDPTVTIDFEGAYSVTPELEPAARPGVRIAFPWRHKLNGGDTLSLEPYFEQWSLGRSENVSFRSGRVTLTVHEPQSETRHSGVRLVWSKIF